MKNERYVTWENPWWKDWFYGRNEWFSIVKLKKKCHAFFKIFSFSPLGSHVSWKDDKRTQKREMVCFWAITVPGPPSKKLSSFWLNKLT